MSVKPTMPKAVGLYHCERCDVEYNAAELVTFDDLWEIQNVLDEYIDNHPGAVHLCSDTEWYIGSIIGFTWLDPDNIVSKLRQLTTKD